MLNWVTKNIQKTQRGLGKSFVSRTQLNPHKYQRDATIVFRVVLANPLTTMDILEGMLTEQREIAARPRLADKLNQVRQMLES